MYNHTPLTEDEKDQRALYWAQAIFGTLATVGLLWILIQFIKAII